MTTTEIVALETATRLVSNNPMINLNVIVILFEFKPNNKFKPNVIFFFTPLVITFNLYSPVKILKFKRNGKFKPKGHILYIQNQQ